jgi:hypothetical protein
VSLEQANLPLFGFILYLYLMVVASSFDQALGWLFEINIFMSQFIYSRSFF